MSFAFFSENLAKFFEFWHKYISLALPRACRHEPSCSVYGAEALRTHGFFRGLGLTLWRFLRCNPWGSHGYDPVPLQKR
jgi:putative membrane protein insertion efficiency factor